ncbi:hypothetical protein SDC9_140011 [bioreactor metagenome]|uniref:Uncharacterized protein n=1 Tax=bioreactor metagenome TaxID=1076179 RepID=A0A645DUB0_9ZZZZ
MPFCIYIILAFFFNIRRNNLYLRIFYTYIRFKRFITRTINYFPIFYYQIKHAFTSLIF